MSFSGRTWDSKSHDEGSIPSTPAYQTIYPINELIKFTQLILDKHILLFHNETMSDGNTETSTPEQGTEKTENDYQKEFIQKANDLLKRASAIDQKYLVDEHDRGIAVSTVSNYQNLGRSADVLNASDRIHSRMSDHAPLESGSVTRWRETKEDGTPGDPNGFYDFAWGGRDVTYSGTWSNKDDENAKVVTDESLHIKSVNQVLANMEDAVSTAEKRQEDSQIPIKVTLS